MLRRAGGSAAARPDTIPIAAAGSVQPDFIRSAADAAHAIRRSDRTPDKVLYVMPLDFMATEIGFDNGMGGASNAAGDEDLHYVLFGKDGRAPPRPLNGLTLSLSIIWAASIGRRYDGK